jgi:hypothetical protein
MKLNDEIIKYFSFKSHRPKRKRKIRWGQINIGSLLPGNDSEWPTGTHTHTHKSDSINLIKKIRGIQFLKIRKVR